MSFSHPLSKWLTRNISKKSDKLGVANGAGFMGIVS